MYCRYYLQGFDNSGVDVSLPAEEVDEDEALREAEERFLQENSINREAQLGYLNPEDQLGYTVEEDGSFYPADGPYGGYSLLDAQL